MKRILGIFFFVALISSSASFADRRYSIERVKIHAVIDSTGGVWIDESRAYRFKGRFRFATYELPLTGIADITNISVREAERDYREMRSDSDKETPDSYRVERDQESVTIRWFYDANNETRTFDLRFYLKGVAVAHADVAEFYYKFVGAGWDRPAGRVEVTVQLPGAAQTGEMKIWAHGPLHGACEIASPGVARFDISPLPKRTVWEGRVIFPRHLLPVAFLRTERTALPSILEEERVWAEEANRRREGELHKMKAQRLWQEQNLSWLLAANLAGVMLLFYLYNRFGRSLLPVSTRLEMPPPTDLPPVLANYYFAGAQLSAGALVSTLIDLARRGFLNIREESKEKAFLGWRWNKQEHIIHFARTPKTDNQSAMQPHEQELLRYLKVEIAQDAGSLPFSAIAKNHGKFMKWFGKWRKQIKKMVEDKEYFDPDSIRAAVRGSLGMLLLIGLGIFATVKMGKTGIPFILSGAALAGLSFVIVRYSKETATLRGRVLGFRDYLKRLVKNKSGLNLGLQNLEPVLVYAMAVDFPSHLLKKFLMPFEHAMSNAAFPWYIYGSSGHAGFAESMSGMVMAISSTMSSASGAGGGASGGGGGGAGGSGGGAG
jgi:uncharacterized membrane protein